MSFLAAIATTGEFLGVAKDVRDLASAATSTGDKRRLKTVFEALEKLYFTPNGILAILTQIASGLDPEADEVQAALLDFNDGEWAVQQAARALDFGALSAAEFPLRLRTSLQAAAYGKLSLRRDLQNALNQPSAKLLISQAEAKELIEKITTLNSTLEAIDEKLR